MGPVRKALQQATAASHRALDQLPELARLLHDDLSVQDHAKTLTGLIAATSVIEAALDQWPMGISRKVWRHPGLAARGVSDLAALGHARPWPAPVPDRFVIESEAAYAGAMYVLEGSALGGRFIANHWVRQGHSQRPSSYFLEAGEISGQRWQDFCVWLESTVAPASIEAAVQAARSAFAVFHSAMACPDYSRP